MTYWSVAKEKDCRQPVRTPAIGEESIHVPLSEEELERLKAYILKVDAALGDHVLSEAERRDFRKLLDKYERTKKEKIVRP